MFRFGVLYLCRGREARCFSSQAYQFLTRLYKEHSLAGGEVTSPTQEPTKACGGALHSLIIVIAWIQMERCVNALASIEGVNFLCVLSNISQNRVSSFTLFVPQGEIHAVWPTLWLVEEDIVFHSGKPERARHATNP